MFDNDDDFLVIVVKEEIPQEDVTVHDESQEVSTKKGDQESQPIIKDPLQIFDLYENYNRELTEPVELVANNENYYTTKETKKSPIDEIEIEIQIDVPKNTKKQNKKHNKIDVPKNTKKQKTKQNKRTRLISTDVANSYVEKLRKEHKMFLEDDNALIDYLSKEMKIIKPPLPPEGYASIVENTDCYQCASCDQITNSQFMAAKHYTEKHGERYLVCFACGVDFRSTTNLYKHEKRCSHPDSEIVLRARAASVGLKGANRPFLTPTTEDSVKQIGKGPSRRYECPHCHKKFAGRIDAESHALSHMEERPYQCDSCDAAYTGKHTLKRHILAKHSGLEHNCPKSGCDKTYTTRGCLMAHIASQHSDRKFVCTKCGKKCMSNNALRSHEERMHMGTPRPCACNICPKRYNRMSELKVHMKKEHGFELVTKHMLKTNPTKLKSILNSPVVIVKSEETLGS